MTDTKEKEQKLSSVPDSEELKAFVSSTLRAIMSGIAEVQDDARLKSAHGTGEFGFGAPKDVMFDIAVNAKRTGAKKRGFKVEVFSVGANAGASKTKENSTISRIQFSIPTKYRNTEND